MCATEEEQLESCTLESQPIKMCKPATQLLLGPLPQALNDNIDFPIVFLTIKLVLDLDQLCETQFYQSVPNNVLYLCSFLSYSENSTEHSLALHSVV